MLYSKTLALVSALLCGLAWATPGRAEDPFPEMREMARAQMEGTVPPAAAGLPTAFGFVKVSITLKLKSPRLKKPSVTCSAYFSNSRYLTYGGKGHNESATGAQTAKGNTTTCVLIIAFSWPQVDASKDSMSVVVNVNATSGASGDYFYRAKSVIVEPDATIPTKGKTGSFSTVIVL